MYIRLSDNSSMHKKIHTAHPQIQCLEHHAQYSTISTSQTQNSYSVTCYRNWIWKILNSSGIWDCVPGKQMVQSYFLVSKFSQVLSLLQRETKATSKCGQSELCQTPHRKSSFPWQVCNKLQHKNNDHCW